MDPTLIGSIFTALIGLIGVILHKSRCISSCSSEEPWTCTVGFTDKPLPDNNALETIQLQNDTLIYRKKD